MTHAYIISKGPYGSDGSFEFLCGEKKTAETILKRDGFRYNKQADIWEQEDRWWRRIERIEYRDEPREE